MEKVPLAFVLYVDPAFKIVRPPDPLQASPVPPGSYEDDPLEPEVEHVRITNATSPPSEKPVLATLRDTAPPTDAVVIDPSSRRGKLLRRNNEYLRKLLPEFQSETWPDMRFKLRKLGVQVAALRCLIQPDQAKAFLERIRSETLSNEGVRVHIPPTTRKSLLALGIATLRPSRATREATIVSKEARQRRNHALYIYTGSRRRGKATSNALAMDHACKDLLQARLHVPQQGRVTAYCYEISFEKPLESIHAFIQGALQLRVTDPLVRIAARSPMAIIRLNQYIATLNPQDAEKVRSILGPLKSLEPELKWTKTGPVPRDPTPKNGFVFDPNATTTYCTDPESIGGNIRCAPDVVPSPRQDESRSLDVAVIGMRPEKEQRKPLEAVSFVVFPSDSPGGIVPTVRLKQLLDALPNRASFVLTSYGDAPAAALKVGLDDEEAVATFLRTTRLLQDNGFRFVVQPFEAEMWFSKFLDETFEPEDVATLVTPCWDRALPGAGDRD